MLLGMSSSRARGSLEGPPASRLVRQVLAVAGTRTGCFLPPNPIRVTLTSPRFEMTAFVTVWCQPW